MRRDKGGEEIKEKKEEKRRTKLKLSNGSHGNRIFKKI
jgi:hypothetical protein